MRYFASVVLCIFVFMTQSWAGSLKDFSNLNLLPTSSIFDFSSTNLSIETLKPNQNTKIGLGLSSDIEKWNLCSGKYSLDTQCLDSNYIQPFSQILIGPQINFESKSLQGGFESNISYTTSSALPIESSSSAPASINRFKMQSSVKLNLTDNANLNFIGEYKHNQIDKNPNSIINNIPKDEFGFGLKLNIGF